MEASEQQIFGAYEISEAQFREILKMWSADIGALTASKLCRVNKNTTHWVYGLLRYRAVRLAKAQSAPFTGSVEVDESYFGPRRIRGLRERGAGRKVAVANADAIDQWYEKVISHFGRTPNIIEPNAATAIFKRHLEVTAVE